MKPALSIEAFADWCEKQPAGSYYDYDDINNCACSQYSKAIGISEFHRSKNRCVNSGWPPNK